MIIPTVIAFAILSAFSNIAAISHPASHPTPAGAHPLPNIPIPLTSFPLSCTPPIFNSSSFPAANLVVNTRPIVCYRSIYRRTPSITNPSDCGIALCELFASGRAIAPEQWGPGINPYQSWTWGSCGLFLVPRSPSSQDTFSRLEIAQEAQRVVAECVTEAYEYRGGLVGIGETREFTLMVRGIIWRGERKDVGNVR